MKSFDQMNFYTTTELAERLKMNIQVIARKLQSGEIKGYKIGKDWRVEEADIQAWLDKLGRETGMTPREKVLGSFMKDGRFTRLPAQRKRRVYLLEHILREFDPSRTYTEKQVDEIIHKYHEDHCFVRREMICEKMMMRKDGIYRRNSSYINIPE